MRLARRGGLLLLALALLLVGYETVAVLRARARTPAILAAHGDRTVTVATLPARRVAMLLRVEDPGFLTHKGVDFSTPGAGATTITQGLVKRLYFERFEPGFAKIEQSLIAWLALHPAASKREQLDLMLNYAWFGSVGGRPVIGFARAAQAFHRRPLSALSDREYLSLVAMLIAPLDLNPVRRPAANAARVRRIGALLAKRCVPRDHDDVWLEGCAGVTG